MKRTRSSRILAAALTLVMLLTMLPLSVLAAPKTYVLDASTDMTTFAAGTKKDGDSEKAGTEGYFTVIYSAKSKLDTSNKSFADGYSASQRINMQDPTKLSGTGAIMNAVQVKTSGAATVKIWWVVGDDNRYPAIFDSQANAIAKPAAADQALLKNALAISQLQIPAAGTYYIGNAVGNNYFFKIEVTEASAGGPVIRGPWSSVAAPVITSAADNGDGKIQVTVQADVSNDGGDMVAVQMYDAGGKLVDESTSVMEKKEHILSFSPEASGNYTFTAELRREGENAKKSASSGASFVLPLQQPNIMSGTSKGEGRVELVWTPVAEATSYEILMDGKPAGSTAKTSFTVQGLNVGQKYTFHVVAVRGEEKKSSDSVSVTATQDAQSAWGFTAYGASTNRDNNGYEGGVNEKGFVTVYSEGGKGKIVPGSTDGVAFYYTAIPTEYNFTLRATVSVDSWTLSNGQEGFGLLATDRLGESGDSGNFWNNSYMAAATKIEYRYDAELDREVLDGGAKYTMKMGLGVISKTGITKENLPMFEKNDTDTITRDFLSLTQTLETKAGYGGYEAGTYNIVGNGSAGTLPNVSITTFDLEIQKNNTGYFVTYYAEDGSVACRRKYYDPQALSQLDEDFVYAGFFAARNARATFSDIQLTTILASQDAPAEEKPITKIDPFVTVSSGAVTTSGSYNLLLDPNVSGNVTLLVDDQKVVDNVYLEALKRFSQMIDLPKYGDNNIRIEFTPDANQDLGPDTELSTTKMQIFNHGVTYNAGNYHRNNIYVSPDGLPYGAGTQEYPFDIYTAINNVLPGQTIVLMEGTYKMTASLKIQRGMNGTADAPIRMIADPNAATRPVLDFQGEHTGMVHGGDYWYFAGFDVTNSQPGQKGFQVSGSYNVLDQIHTYRNGNSGVQISRYMGSDKTIDQWPAHNLVLNCTSYLNADPGEEDADGFAAKLTCGEGNVFDGCVAYNNADDGWDLYAKLETGSIGAVTIQNCVAYANGVREDGTVSKGNGNGFKMGGESLSGKHVLINCVSFNNKSKGIDSNSCPDIIIRDSISYNNGTHNVALYTNNAANTDFSAQGIISFKDENILFQDALTKGENLKPKGSQDESKYMGSSNFYWNGSASANSAGKKFTADMFKSLEFKGVVRKADGSWDLQGFLELNHKAPAGSGTTGASTPSQDMSLKAEDKETFYSPDWSYTELNGQQNMYYHWHACQCEKGCADKGQMEPHNFQWVIDKELVGDTPGQRHEECTVCHYKKPAVAIYPEGQDPADPSAPVDPNQPAPEPQGISPLVIVLIVVAVVALAAGGFLLVKFVILKKPE